MLSMQLYLQAKDEVRKVNALKVKAGETDLLDPEDKVAILAEYRKLDPEGLLTVETTPERAYAMRKADFAVIEVKGKEEKVKKVVKKPKEKVAKKPKKK